MDGGTHQGPDDDAVPQLWDLAAATARPEDDYALAAEVQQAELAGLGLAERLAGGVGQQVRLTLVDEIAVRGTMLAALTDGLVVADDSGVVIVPVAAIRLAAAAGFPRPVAGRRSVRSEARELVGTAVTVLVAGAGTVTGQLVAVGADHLVVARGADRVIVPLVATALLRRR